MDNHELYSRIRDLESKHSDLRSDTFHRMFYIWMVMFVGFYFLAFIGLCLIHQASTDAVREMRNEIAATVPPRVGSTSIAAGNCMMRGRIRQNSANGRETPE